MDLDDRWTRWCRRFDQAHQDIRSLFHHRHVFLFIRTMWDQNAESIDLNTIVWNWHVRLYVNSQCTGIRRECDPNPRTSSLENCLAELTKYPQMANRARFNVAIDANTAIPSNLKDINKTAFNTYAVSTTASDLDVVKVQSHIDALRKAAITTRTYTNKIIAHREFTSKKIGLKWADLDAALNCVGETFKHYYPLRNPGTTLGALTPELPLGWEDPYRIPWCPTGLRPEPAWSFDAYLSPTAQTSAKAPTRRKN